ncbi:MAG: amidohydrolase [Acidimicrobiales bacterium]
MSDSPSTVLSGATVITMDPARPRADAVALRGGTILAVGALAEVLRRAGDGARVVDLGGGSLLPGFIDPHHHLFLVAADRWSCRLHGRSPRGIPELLEEIRRVAAADDGEGWLRVHGYQPLALAERRSPTAAELDSICPGRPLHLLGLTYHESSLNSAGLARLGWDRRSADPPGGRIVRDRRGRPTGVLVESASFLAEAASRESMLADGGGEDWFDRAERHSLALARAGITRIGDAAVPPAGMALYEQAAASGRLAITVHRFPVGVGAISEPADVTDPTGAGDPRIPVGPAKLLADGGERCELCLTGRQVLSSVSSTLRATLSGGLLAATVANRGGWARRGPDGRYHTGIRVLSDDRLCHDVLAAAARGMQVAVHAVGNGAVSGSVDAFEAARGALAGLPGRPRLEHAMVLDLPLAARVADVDALVVTQPVFLHDLGDELTVLPLPPPLRLLALRTLLDAGVTVAASSDFPAGSFDPLIGIRTAVTRRLPDGSIAGPDEAVSTEEALRLYTSSAAEALGMAGLAGVISEGATADLVVLSADPLTTDPDRLGDLRVVQTWVDGRQVIA